MPVAFSFSPSVHAHTVIHQQHPPATVFVFAQFISTQSTSERGNSRVLISAGELVAEFGVKKITQWPAPAFYYVARETCRLFTSNIFVVSQQTLSFTCAPGACRRRLPSIALLASKSTGGYKLLALGGRRVPVTDPVAQICGRLDYCADHMYQEARVLRLLPPEKASRRLSGRHQADQPIAAES